MRIAVYDDRGTRRAGIITGRSDDTVITPLAVGTDVLQVLDDHARGDRSGFIEPAGRALPLSQVRLLAPVLPPTVRDFLTFEEHVEGVRRSIDGAAGVAQEWYTAPAFYFSNPYAILGPADDVPMAPGSTVLDFELEVAAVIGRAGHDLTPGQARDAIVGYTIFNDWSARDLQKPEMKVGLGPAKGKDTASTLGPWIVTPDELEQHRDVDGFLDLQLTATVNGEVVGSDRLSHMGWTFEDMVVYASRGTWVRPGDVLGSGTCGHGGCLAELWGRNGSQYPAPLRPGDTVTLTVQGIGSLTTRVVPGVAPIPVPAARHRLADRIAERSA